MPGVIPDEGEVHMLAVMLGAVAVESIALRLYTNDYTPGLTDTAAAYVEMTGHGYVAKTLPTSTWSFTPADAGLNTPGKAQAALESFIFTAEGAPAFVYGYYLTGLTSGRLWGAGRFAEAFRVQNAGDQLDVTPVLRLRSGYP